MSNNYIIVITSLIFSALFSGSEMAFFTSNRLKIALAKNNKSWSANILSKFLENPSSFIATLLLGNTITLVVFSLAMEPILSNEILPKIGLGNIQSTGLIVFIQTIISTIIVLVFAEFLPKSIFKIQPNLFLNFLAIPLYIIYLILYPIVYIVNKTAYFFLVKILKQELPLQDTSITWVDLDKFIREFTQSTGNKGIDQEAHILQAALDFKEIKLRECMVPRTEIIAVEKNESIPDLINKFVETGHSKILVYNSTIDDIIGYVHSFDLFNQPPDLQSIIRKVEYFPETMRADKALKKLTHDKISVAIILDEFGGTSGMVTLEDLIEEIFGEINDEYDSNSINDRKINEKEYIFSGRAEIDYINNKYELNLPKSDEYETIAGLILHYYEGIPPNNEQITIEPYCFHILQSTGKRIEKVKMTVKT